MDRFDLATHARFSLIFITVEACFVVFHKKKFKKKKRKLGKKMQNFFNIALQMLYVFLPDISVHCALIDYA
jgi:hypothetical protein